MIERGGAHEITITRYEDFSPSELTDGLFFLSDGKKTRTGLQTSFLRLYNSSISLLKITRGNEEEFIGVCPKLTGTQLNEVFYFGAPSDSFGLDTFDLNSDWQDLYKPGSDLIKKDRMQDHAAIPGWEHFSRNQRRIRELIFDDVLGHKGPNYVPERITPVIRINKTKAGFEWNFNDFGNQFLQEIQDTLDLSEHETRNLYPSLGAIFTAAFSPNVRTTCWKTSDTHTRQRMNTIGATQSWAYSLWKGNLLFGDNFLEKMLEKMNEKLSTKQTFQLQVDRAIAKWDKSYGRNLHDGTIDSVGWYLKTAYDLDYGFVLKVKPHVVVFGVVDELDTIKIARHAKGDKHSFSFNIPPKRESSGNKNSLRIKMTEKGKLCLQTEKEIIGCFAPEDIFSITLVPPQNNS